MKGRLHSGQEGERAFTRLELVASIAAVVLLITIIVPALANSGARSDRVTCFNNLRQIGIGYSQFGLESYDNRPPWRLPMAQGGNNDHPLKNQLYGQFSIISNYLASPRHLSDPADTRPGKSLATRWDHNANGGLLYPGYQNRAISYFLGLDGHFRVARAILAGDRNIIVAERNASSGSSFINPHARIDPSATAWTNEVHGLDGNLLFYDGSVDQLDSAGLRAALGAPDVSAPLNPPRYRALFPF